MEQVKEDCAKEIGAFAEEKATMENNINKQDGLIMDL